MINYLIDLLIDSKACVNLYCVVLLTLSSWWCW